MIVRSFDSTNDPPFTPPLMGPLRAVHNLSNECESPLQLIMVSFRRPIGGTGVCVSLPSRGLEMRLGEGRLLRVPNTRNCALRGHNSE